MGLIDIASSKSAWRGMEYYKQNKVLSHTVNEDGSCEGPPAIVLWQMERKSYANIL